MIPANKHSKINTSDTYGAHTKDRSGTVSNINFRDCQSDYIE